ncbi:MULTISPECIES: EAL domain-containing protein [Marinomonas]|nr:MULTISPECIES: EAL domain-containing protein [Marinomonas]
MSKRIFVHSTTMSFVEECDSHTEDAKIYVTIIHLARSLELGIVAEGVETAQQADMLQS